VDDAQKALTGIKETYTPDPEKHIVYKEMYRLYSQMHDAFGTVSWSGVLHNVMKDLIALREKQRISK
jgi:L-ribulokinase